MGKYILKKIIYFFITMFIIITATFFMMNCMPGDATQADTKVLPAAVVENLKARWGLDKPVFERYLIYLGNLLQGQFGESYKTPGMTANQVIAERFPASLQLGLQAVAVGLIIGLILGILAALHRGRVIDFVCIFIAIIGVSVPSFVFAALLQRFAGGGFFPIIGWPSKGLRSAGQGQRLLEAADHLETCDAECPDADHLYCGSSDRRCCHRFLCHRADFLDSRTWKILC